jgi:prolipoprotein diacylglyceryltransferase
MTLEIDPNAFGSPLLPWSALLTLVGALGGLGLMLRWAPSLGISRRDMYRLGLRVAVWALLGGRLLHILEFWDFYREVPFQTLYLWNGGVSLWGALFGGTAGALWHARRLGAPLRAFADRLAFAGLIAMAWGRLGDFLAGARPGTPTSLPWGVRYADSSSQAHVMSGEVHPVALYELLLDVTLIALLARFRHRLAPDGAALVAAFAGYAAGRFLISFSRLAATALGLQQAQWIALGVLVAAALYAWRVRQSLRAGGVSGSGAGSEPAL